MTHKNESPVSPGRLNRDIRCCGLMPAKSDECLSYVGKEAFGTDINKISETYW